MACVSVLISCYDVLLLILLKRSSQITTWYRTTTPRIVWPAYGLGLGFNSVARERNKDAMIAKATTRSKHVKVTSPRISQGADCNNNRLANLDPT